MIIVKLIGGLGNQMFQYAMARSLADHYDVSLKLDIADFEHYTLRRYELVDFNIRAEVASKQDINTFNISTKRNSLSQRIKRHFVPLVSKTVFRETSFAYNERVLSVMPPVYLDGYWQTERYFSHNSVAIRRDFTLHEQLDVKNVEMQAQIEAVNAVSLHVRRGDYVNDPHTNYSHGVCSLDYYHDAVKYIVERVAQLHLFVFSDDHEWAQGNLNFQYPATFVNHNSNKRGIFDMLLMQHCQHHIIANSSFSWWGAWLNPSPHKIVVAPRRWFNKASHDTRDLIPPTWIIL
ncbi:MAG: alpha-1,2-fucosyltransferase [Proteobacteria bacterium]|nr:alpha-1,2-fucosyltransferase [Pseudomonadota bacterium]